MRLLHTQSLRVIEFNPDSIPSYAILSHTWGDDEITYQDMQRLEEGGAAAVFGSRRVKQKKGYPKVEAAAGLAKRDGFDYIWIDTCCIDKSSSAELSEAINSMYRWYEQSSICYAFLSDVAPRGREAPHEAGSTFRLSRWFTRGWTLQELIAPRQVHFFCSDWTLLGSKIETDTKEKNNWGIGVNLLSSITGIDRRVLSATITVEEISVAARMSWASLRNTTREEDIAYCLLGIFAVNMPLLYGEGKRAFLRLQEAILHETDDQSLLAWRYEAPPDPLAAPLHGLLSPSPLYFKHSSEIRPLPPLLTGDPVPPTLSSQGLNIQLYLRPIHNKASYSDRYSDQLHDYHAILDCSVRDKGQERYPAITLRRLYGKQFARVRPELITKLKAPGLEVPLDGEGYKPIYVRQKPVWILPDFIIEETPDDAGSLSGREYYTVRDVWPREQWDASSRSLKSLQPRINRVMGVFRFGDPAGDYGDAFIAVGIRRGASGQTRPWVSRLSWSGAQLDVLYTRLDVQGPLEDGILEDTDLHYQALAQEITRHGRSYISLRVMKRQEIGSMDIISSHVGQKPKLRIDRALLASLLLSNRVEDPMTHCIFVSSISSTDIRVRPMKQPAATLRGLVPTRLAVKAPLGQGTVMERALLEACREGHRAKVAKILSQGTSPEIQVEKFHDLRPLHLAALFGHAKVVRALLDAGADPAAAAAGRITPLHLAALTGSKAVVDVLLDHARFSRRDLLLAKTQGYRETPLHLATVSEHCTPELLSALSVFEADAEAQPDSAKETTASKPFIQSVNLLREEPFHRAAAYGNKSALKWLIDVWKESRPAFSDFNRETLCSAVAGGSVDVVRMIGRGRPPPRDQDTYPRTPLHLACYEGRSDIVAVLLQYPAQESPNDAIGGRNNDGVSIEITPCHVASLFGYVECLKLLINGGADVNQSMLTNTEGQVQPIHLAAAQGHLECVKILARNGAKTQSLGSLSFRARKVERIRPSDQAIEGGIELLDWYEWDPPVTAASMALAQGHSEVAAWLEDESEA